MSGPVAVGAALQGVMLRTLARRLRAPGQTRPCTLQARILMALHAQGAGGMSVIAQPSHGDLARALGVSRPAVSRAWALLVARGVIAHHVVHVNREVRRAVWQTVFVPCEVVNISIRFDHLPGFDARPAAPYSPPVHHREWQ